MQTKTLNLETISEAAELIKAGQLVAFPTETVYGLGADATNETAVKQVYLAKGRPSDNPLIVHIADVETVKKYAASLSPDALKLMDAFWPGPLTLIFKLKPNVLSPAVTGGLDTAAFRFPDNQATLALIKAAGVPMVGPSANTSGKPSPTTAEHVLHDLSGKIAAVVDDGPTRVGVESTVLDMSVETPTILRPGGVSKDEIEAVLAHPINDEQHHVGIKEVPKAPGMKYKHYAPNAQVYIVDQPNDWPAVVRWINHHPQEIVGVMGTDDIINNIDWPENARVVSLGADVQSASHRLFDELREFDNHSEVKSIFTQAFETTGLGEAYMNRLNKSAGQSHFDQQMMENAD
ncbi:Sua5 YciO YrdC YwlC family protein [Lentilactobacillus senioris DSM 24302 = JCM 17472]|uniref:Threonylcarbamoyl-AMP synthase n=1 Tax=Lentilactobacillus senioris DSM 24302 = JCM 17472 TaxID=1423802 RepID=A0A0R2CPR7_9LACO|nr:L-threonylcarbamoyladenylate synthase [Lentilactobacillus senioris]KRM93624.1 Sua5 YciO YrdC YwlC family protein [Lentilactobacillus senioris DSM 24302 = JCM 17472]